MMLQIKTLSLGGEFMRVIGLMSGTSADGIDVALCELSGAPPQLSAKIVTTYYQAYDDTLRYRILDACSPKHSSVDAICRLNFDLANFFADAILHMLKQADISPADVDLIGSHGQTIWHDVDDNGAVTSTLQITSGAVLAERTGITTINNFRERDVIAGGQGAPLTGYADWLLLRHETHWRAIQNIGGMANVTFLPPLSDTNSQPIAFDTGPGNALIDAVITAWKQGTRTYDPNGDIARSGQVNERMVDWLMQHPYIQRDIPKTTGRETFGTEYAMALLDSVTGRDAKRDLVSTLTMFTSATIADAYRRFAPAPIGEVIIGGGGRHNRTMMDMLKNLLGATPIRTHEDIGLDSDFKEALVFAVLAYETWHGRVGTLPAQTGARHGSVLGQITPGANYADLIRSTWA